MGITRQEDSAVTMHFELLRGNGRVSPLQLLTALKQTLPLPPRHLGQDTRAQCACCGQMKNYIQTLLAMNFCVPCIERAQIVLEESGESFGRLHVFPKGYYPIDLAEAEQSIEHLEARLSDHSERERVLVEALRNYRELDHATCYNDEKTGLDHRCTKCKIADLALSKVRQQ